MNKLNKLRMQKNNIELAIRKEKQRINNKYVKSCKHKNTMIRHEPYNWYCKSEAFDYQECLDCRGVRYKAEDGKSKWGEWK